MFGDGQRRVGRRLVLACAAAWFPLLVHAQGVNQAARAALPDKLKQSGVLEVATSLQWPPFDYKTEDGQPDGIDIRLVKAVAARLGLTVNFTDVKFPVIVPGVSTGRFDAGVDQLANTAERRKVVQFADYYRGGMGLLVRQGTKGINVGNLCGHTLALTQGSAQVAVAQQISDKCVADGTKPIEMLYFPNSADTYLAVANGRGDGFLTDRAVGIYIAQHNDKLSMTEGILAEPRNIAGIVIARDNNQLASAVRMVLLDMARDGSYQKLLGEFGVAEAALTVEDLQKPPVE